MVIFEALFGCHDVQILGNSPIKWMQHSDITIAVDWYVKHQFKQTNKNKSLPSQGIKKTCLCIEYPFIPHFYIAKLGYAGVYLFFLFCSKTSNVGTHVPTIYVLSKNKKNIKKNSTENFQFLQLKKNLYITWACFHIGQCFSPVSSIMYGHKMPMSAPSKLYFLHTR